MAEYYYDVEDEVFKRKDKRGNHLAINISEAQRIITLVNLGYSNAKINAKVRISNPKCGGTTIDSFIKNYKLGNIKMPEDAPAPRLMFNRVLEDTRIDDLEERIIKLENDLEEFKKLHFSEKCNDSLKDKVKSWLKQ